MNTMLVWILVTVSNSYGITTYSPPFVDLASCERMQSQILKVRPSMDTVCVQVKVPK